MANLTPVWSLDSVGETLPWVPPRSWRQHHANSKDMAGIHSWQGKMLHGCGKRATQEISLLQQSHLIKHLSSFPKFQFFVCGTLLPLLALSLEAVWSSRQCLPCTVYLHNDWQSNTIESCSTSSECINSLIHFASSVWLFSGTDAMGSFNFMWMCIHVDSLRNVFIWS